MRIFDVEFANTKYSGEGNKTVTVSARSITEAERLATKILPKREDVFGSKTNWQVIRVEEIAQTEN